MATAKNSLDLPKRLQNKIELFGTRELTDEEIEDYVKEFYLLKDKDNVAIVRFFNDLYRSSMKGWNEGRLNMTSTSFTSSFVKIHARVKPILDDAAKKLSQDKK